MPVRVQHTQPPDADHDVCAAGARGPALASSTIRAVAAASLHRCLVRPHHAGLLRHCVPCSPRRESVRPSAFLSDARSPSPRRSRQHVFPPSRELRKTFTMAPAHQRAWRDLFEPQDVDTTDTAVSFPRAGKIAVAPHAQRSGSGSRANQRARRRQEVDAPLREAPWSNRISSTSRLRWYGFKAWNTWKRCRRRARVERVDGSCCLRCGMLCLRAGRGDADRAERHGDGGGLLARVAERDTDAMRNEHLSQPRACLQACAHVSVEVPDVRRGRATIRCD